MLLRLIEDSGYLSSSLALISVLDIPCLTLGRTEEIKEMSERLLNSSATPLFILWSFAMPFLTPQNL